MEFIETLINGLSIGSTYAMIALGYTMVYGIAKMLNFAHGDVIMVGGYMIYVGLTVSGNPIISFIAAVLSCIILGITIEKIAYRPLRGASPLAVLITAIGVSYLLQSSAQMILNTLDKEYLPLAEESLKNLVSLIEITKEKVQTQEAQLEKIPLQKTEQK